MTGILLSAKIGGRPRTKGSLKPICTRDAKHTVHLKEQVTESPAWRRKVARGLREAQLEQHGRLLKHEGPVEVRLVFFMPREQSVSGGPIPTHATEWPTAITVGDIDKLIRNVLDAMLTPPAKCGRSELPEYGALLADDSQVVLLSVGKFWVPQDTEPGVQILVMEVTGEQAEREAALGRVHVTAPDLPGTPRGCAFFLSASIDEDSDACMCEHTTTQHEFGTGACAARTDTAPYSPEVCRG